MRLNKGWSCKLHGLTTVHSPPSLPLLVWSVGEGISQYGWNGTLRAYFLRTVMAVKPHKHSLFPWSLAFLVIAVIAGIVGFTDLAGRGAGFAKIAFLMFLALFILSFIAAKCRV
jgi:uncharacterized membrane protein YtjA (UPF0391 family)